MIHMASNRVREFCATECSTLMHGTAFQATDALI